jgi:hypothetical protein
MISLIQTQPRSLIRMLRDTAESGVWFNWGMPPRDVRFVQLNRPFGQFVEMWDSGANTRELLVYGVVVRRRTQRLDAPVVSRAGRWVPVPGWMAGVTLGMITVHNETVFFRDLKIDRYQVK